MIIYRRRGLAKYGILCRCNGTVLLRTIPWALVSGVLAWVLSYFDWPACTADQLANNDCGMKHPAAFTWYFSLSTFMLAFNSSNAFQRYWEARTHLQTVTSQLALLGSHVISLCTPSLRNERDLHSSGAISEDELRQKLEAIAVFKAKTLHMITLLHALMMMYFLNQDWTENVEVLGGLTFAESRALSRCNDQVYLVESWLSELIIQAFGGDKVLSKQPPPPVVSRLWALLEQIMAAFMGACKVEDTPFPYPYQQLMGLMAAVNCILIPFFANGIIWDPVYTTILSILISFLFRAIYETILISELPFGSQPNDLPFRLVHHQFVSRMRDLVDKDTFNMLKEWNLLFTLSEVIVCRDGITTFAPWTNRRAPLHEVIQDIEADDCSSEDPHGDPRSNKYYRPEVHEIWTYAGQDGADTEDVESDYLRLHGGHSVGEGMDSYPVALGVPPSGPDSRELSDLFKPGILRNLKDRKKPPTGMRVTRVTSRQIHWEDFSNSSRAPSISDVMSLEN